MSSIIFTSLFIVSQSEVQDVRALKIHSKVKAVYNNQQEIDLETWRQIFTF